VTTQNNKDFHFSITFVFGCYRDFVARGFASLIWKLLLLSIVFFHNELLYFKL